MSINQVMLTGTVVDCQDKIRQDGSVWGGEVLIRTTVIKGRGKDRKEETITIPLKYFGEQASKFPIGREVLIGGSLSGREYQGKYYPEILAREVILIDNGATAKPAPARPPEPAANSESEDDLPF